MSKPHLRKRVVYATAVVLLAVLSSCTERAMPPARPSMHADSTTIERGRYI